MKKMLGVDIGGTKISYALIDEEGNIINEVQKSETPKTKNEIEELLKEIILKFENEVSLVALATAGAVNNENNAVIGSTANLPKGYKDIDFKSLSKKTVFIENDANCAAWAEYRIGAAKGFDNSVMLTLGTGVGGGIIVNGKLLKGKSGAAGEMHFPMSRTRLRSCTCGFWDCFEAYASGNGLRRTGIDVTGNNDITTYDIIDGVKRGNQETIKAFNIWQNDIAAGIVGLANIFDPDCVILSGSMEKFVDTEKIEEFVNRNIVTTPTRVLHAKAGNYAGMIGAVLLANELTKVS